MFALILGIVERKGLLKGRVLGVDSTALRADAARRAIVRRDTKESCLEFVTRLAAEAGREQPTAEEARRLDRKRNGKAERAREALRALVRSVRAVWHRWRAHLQYGLLTGFRMGAAP